MTGTMRHAELYRSIRFVLAEPESFRLATPNMHRIGTRFTDLAREAMASAIFTAFPAWSLHGTAELLQQEQSREYHEPAH